MSTIYKINNICPKLTVIPPHQPCRVICKADTGATSNYFTTNDAHILKNTEKIIHGPRVNLPNGTILQAHLRGNIPMSENNLSETARRAHVFNGLNNASLISIGRLCDDNCIAVFDRKELNIYKNNKKVIQGTRNYRDGLWDIQLPTGNKASETVSTNIQNNKLQNPEKENNKSHSPETYITVKDSTLGQIYNISEHQANMLVRRDTTKTELAEYYHKCMCSPTLTTLQQAVQKGHLHSWPGIQNLNFKKLVIF